MKDKLSTNLIFSNLYQILFILLPFITAPYVSRVLLVEGMGIFSYTQSYVAIFAMFAALGTNAYGTREIARNRNNIKERSLLFWEIQLLSVFSSTTTIVLWIIWVLLQPDYRVIYGILTICLISNMFDISWLFAGMEAFRYTFFQNIVIKCIGVICIFMFVKNSSDLWKYVLITYAVLLGANLSLWFHLGKFIVSVQFSSLHPIRHLKGTLVFFIPTIAVSVYTILDKTLIGYITKDVSENGYYEQATKIVGIAKTISFTGLNIVLQSRMSFLFAQEQYKKIKENLSASMDYIAFMTIGACFGIIGISKKFVPLFFGNGYDKTIVLLSLLSPVIIFVGISNCLGSQYYNPAGFRSKSTRFIIIGSLVNLTLNIILIPNFKSIGAVIATIVSESLIAILYVKNCNGYYSFGLLFYHFRKKMIAGIIMCVSVYYLGESINQPYLALMLQLILGIAIYLFSIFLFRDSFSKRILFIMKRKKEEI